MRQILTTVFVVLKHANMVSSATNIFSLVTKHSDLL